MLYYLTNINQYNFMTLINELLENIYTYPYIDTCFLVYDRTNHLAWVKN